MGESMTSNNRTQADRRRGMLASVVLMALWPCLDLPAARADDAEDADFRGIKGEVTIEVQSDHTVKSQDPDNERSDTYTTVETAIGWYFNRVLSMHGTFVYEPVLDAAPGEDRLFADEGLYAEELYAQLSFGNTLLYGGKFDPTFGTAWDIAPGVYGTDFAEDYELTERIGIGAAVTSARTPLGAVTLTANLFQLDHSGLSQSAFVNRGRTVTADGGLSNTDGLESYSITIDGSDIPALPGIAYHLGYRHQKRGVTEMADEDGYVAGLSGTHERPHGGFEWAAEVVRLDDAEGTDDTVWYWTVGGKLTFAERYNVAVSYTARPREFADDTADLDDHMLAISGGTELRNGWSIDLGYKYAVEDDVDSHTVGLLLAKSFSFSKPE